jgi:NAD(P)-dependent dehydrogenase (short-subunit alcohol dehydrogenase family)
MPGIQDFEGRVAVVTGGASGIGKGIARALIAEGAKVVIADIEQDALTPAAAELGAVGIRVDVSKEEDVDALAKEVDRRFGRVDIVCNNAGVSPKVLIQDATTNDWRWVIDVNLWGVIYGTKVFLPRLLANPHGGYFLNTASIGAFVSSPMIGPYSVTKAGVVALSESLSAEMQAAKANVGVTVLCPGTVRTNIQTSSRNRPAELSVNAKGIDIDLMKNKTLIGKSLWITADSVGPMAIDAIRRGALYATTHDGVGEVIEAKAKNVATMFRHPRPAPVVIETT